MQVRKCFGCVLVLTSQKIDMEMLIAGKKVRPEKVGGLQLLGQMYGGVELRYGEHLISDWVMYISLY